MLNPIKLISIVFPFFFSFYVLGDIEIEERISLTRNEEKVFIKALIENIRSEIRAGIHFSDYYRACLLDDTEWFSSNTPLNSTLSRRFCSLRVEPLKKKILLKTKKLRLLMGLAQYKVPGEPSPYFFNLKKEKKIYPLHDLKHYKSSTPPPNFYFDLAPGDESQYPKFNSNREMDSYPVERNIEFSFSNSANLEPLSKLEMYQAEKLLYEDLVMRRKYRLGEPISSDEREGATCAFDSREKYIRAGDGCFKDQYLRMIFGDPAKETKALPILAYITSSELNLDSILTALNRIQDNAKGLLKDIEDQYFDFDKNGQANLRQDLEYTINRNLHLFAFHGPLSRTVDLAKEKEGKLDWKPGTYDKWKLFSVFGQTRLTKWTKTKTIFQISGLVAFGVLCNRIPMSQLSKASCFLPTGVLANTYFYYLDSTLFDDFIKIGLYRATGARSMLSDVNRFNELQFNKRLSTVALPFFTGIGSLKSAIKIKF